MTSLLLRPVRLEPSLMFLYDNGGSDGPCGRHAEGGFAGGGDLAPNQCRSLVMAHAASLAPGGAYSLQSSASGDAHASAVCEPAERCSPCSAAQGSSSASLPYGYFGGGGYFPCRAPPHHGGLKPCAAQPPSAAYADKYADAACAAAAGPPREDAFGSSRAKDFAFYPAAAAAYAPGPYQPVPGYLDVPAAPPPPPPPEPRHHEPLLPAEPYPSWGLSAGWGGPLYCPKEPPHPGHVWKSPGPDSACHATGDPGSYRRGRKKRVPYTKAQLKELEREYAANKFITKDKRRRISAQTNLSERQVTIWFQNRRVKEKKVVNKVKSVS